MIFNISDALLINASALQDDYKIGPQQMTYLPSLYGPSNMKFNGKDNFVVEPNEQRWAQTILKRSASNLVATYPQTISFRFSSESMTRRQLEGDRS
jgi:hypothetical protein